MINRSKFIYCDKLSVVSYYRNDEFDITNYGSVFYDKEEGIELMKETISNIIKEDPDCTRENFLDRYDFKYTIFIISGNHLEFDSTSELKGYVENEIKNIDKDELYEFLVSIAEFACEDYDYNGHLICGYIELGFDENYMSQNSIKEDKDFKYGDVVEKKGYPGIRYKIITDTLDIPIDKQYKYFGSAYIVPVNIYNTREEENENYFRYPRSELVLVKGDNENGKD